MWYILENEERQEIIQTSNKIKGEIDPDYPTLDYNGVHYTMGSGSYLTKEELWAHNKILDNPCVVCGKLVRSNYHGREQMVERNMCFSCNLWTNRIQEVKNSKRVMIVDHCMYSLGDIIPTGEKSAFRGFGGRKFVFKRLIDGTTCESTNTWYGGEIPKAFYASIPDNAILIHGYGPTQAL